MYGGDGGGNHSKTIEKNRMEYAARRELENIKKSDKSKTSSGTVYRSLISFCGRVVI